MSARVSAVLITTSFISALVLTLKDKIFPCIAPLVFAANKISPFLTLRLYNYSVGRPPKRLLEPAPPDAFTLSDGQVLIRSIAHIGGCHHHDPAYDVHGNYDRQNDR